MKSEPYQVIWLVRRLFRALAQKSNENLEEFGISAADRAVMEFLYPDKTLSVPEIASQYQVSRQHVQSTINSLLDAKLVNTQENPRHKRSPLMVLSPEGQQLFKAVMKKDETAVAELFAGIPHNEIQITQQTLRSLLNELSGR